jgi:hypothetical protein
MEEVPTLRRPEEPGVALTVGEGRSDRLLPGWTEVPDDPGLVDQDPVVAASSAGVDGVQGPEVDRTAGDEIEPLLDAVGLHDGRTESAFDRPPGIGEEAIGRSEPADLASVDRSVYRELDPEMRLPESPTALEDVEAVGLAEDHQLSRVESVFDRLDLEPHPFVHRVEERPEDLVIPLREFRGPIVGDAERGRLRRVQVRPDDRDLRPAETLRRLERPIPGDDDPATVDDDRLLLAERAERVDDRLEVPLVVLPSVRRIRRRLLDGYGLRLHVCAKF